MTLNDGSSVLTNDTDADSDRMTASRRQRTCRTRSAFTLNPNGTFSYTPTAGSPGTDTFTYKANDGTADSNTVTVTINVTP